MFFSHLECSRPCGAGPFDPRERHHLCRVRRSPARALRPRRRARLAARVAARSRADACGGIASCCRCFDGETPVTLGEGFTPLIHARASAPRSASIAAVHQGRIAQSDELVQGARTVGGDHARARARRDDARRCRPPATPATRSRRTPPRRGSRRACSCPRTSKRPFVDECRALRRARHAGRRPDHRRRPRRRRTGRAARLVRRVHAEGAVPRSKARRRWATSWPSSSTGAARLDHLSDRRRHRPRSGCGRRSRRSRRIGWIRRGARPRMVSVQADGCAPIVRRVRAGRRDRGVV